METYEKFFMKSNIEYTTPFTTLWQSFNNWYMTNPDRKSFEDEREAINYYKKYGKAKYEFFRLIDLDSENGLFQKKMETLVSNLKIYKEKNREFKGEYTTTQEENADKLFSETLEIIYQIRCSLMHGDFDPEDKDFLELVGSAYNIFYPVMDRVIYQQINHVNNLFYSEKLRDLLKSGESPLPLIERVKKDIEILDEETKEHYECNLEKRKDDFIFNKRRGELMILRTFFDNDYYKKFSLEDKKSWDKFRDEFVVLEHFLSPGVRGSGTISMLLYLMIEMKVKDTNVGNFTAGSSELEKKVKNDLIDTIQLLEQSEFVVEGIKEYLENRKNS